MMWWKVHRSTGRKKHLNHISNFILLRHCCQHHHGRTTRIKPQIKLREPGEAFCQSVLFPTCWQAGRALSFAWIFPHSGESLVQAEHSRIFSSTWARCLNAAPGRSGSARKTTSIVCQIGETKRRRWYFQTFYMHRKVKLAVATNASCNPRRPLFTKSWKGSSTFILHWISIKTHHQEVVWCQFQYLKEQREVTRQAVWGCGNLQTTGRQTALEMLVLADDLLQNTSTSFFTLKTEGK